MKRLSGMGLLALMAIFILTGCAGIEGANEATGRLGQLTEDQRARLAAAQRGQVHVANRPYFGTEARADRGQTRGKPLPKATEGPRSLSVNISGAGIKDLAAIITDQTELPVNIRTTYTQPDGKIITIPIASRMNLRYTGTLSKLLDRIAARFDIAWGFDGNTITFDRMETRSYAVSLPSGRSQLQSSFGGVDGGSRSVQMTKSISEYDPWVDLQTQLSAVTPAPARITIANSAGRVSVFAPPSIQANAAAIIDDFEAIFATRIALEVGVYFVDAAKADDFALGLSVSGSSGSFLGRTGILSGDGVITLRQGEVTASMRALAQNSAVVDYRLGSTIAQSGVISPIVLTRSQNYVARTTVTRGDSGTSTQVETGTVDTGISIHALPRLIGARKIQLSLTLLQNDLAALETFGTGEAQVQLPTLDQRALQNDVVLRPGETLILSGYEQESARRSNRGTGAANFLALGGEATGETRKIRMIVVVRPSLLGLTQTASR